MKINLLLFFCLISLPLSCQNLAKIQINPFEKIEGNWIGKGKTYYGGVEENIVDSISFSNSVSDKFLKFDLKEIGGKLHIEGYLYNKGKGVYEFHEFNNGVWPVRHFYGTFKNNTFELIEKTDDRKVLVKIIIVNDAELIIQEYNILEDNSLKIFVDEKLRRI